MTVSLDLPPAERSAAISAERAKDWWHFNGYDQVTVWHEWNNIAQRWVIRSNLRNGMPKGADPVAIGRLYQHRWGGR